MSWRVALLLAIAVGVSAAQQPAGAPGSAGAPAAQNQARPDADSGRPGEITIPAGTQIPLKLAQAITTKNAKPGDSVYAETAFPVVINDKLAIPAGTYVQGRIAQVRRPGRIKGRAEFLMHFTTLVYKNGYTVALPGSVENMPGAEKQSVKDKEGTIQQAGSKGKDAATVASTAGTGAMIGAIASDGSRLKGAAIGGATGGAAGLAIAMLTRGNELTLPEGSSVQMVLDRPLTVQEARIRQP